MQHLRQIYNYFYFFFSDAKGKKEQDDEMAKLKDGMARLEEGNL